MKAMADRAAIGPLRLPQALWLVAALLVGVTIAAPASAQVYDPAYPVCLHVYGSLEGERMDCDFTAWAQCMDSAGGRAATCEMNPYYVGRPGAREPRRPRH